MWLCHEKNQENGSIYEVGGAFVAKLRYAHSKGMKFDPGSYSAEMIEEKKHEIENFEESFFPNNAFEMVKRTGMDLGSDISTYEE